MEFYIKNGYHPLSSFKPKEDYYKEIQINKKCCNLCPYPSKFVNQYYLTKCDYCYEKFCNLCIIAIDKSNQSQSPMLSVYIRSQYFYICFDCLKPFNKEYHATYR